MLSRFIRVVAYGTISFFLWLNNIPLYKWMSRFLSSFMDAWIISTSWLLWVVLQWTRKCRHLFRTEISVSSAVCTEEGLTCHMAAPLQVFEKPPHFSTETAPVYTPSSSVGGVPFLRIYSNTCYLLPLTVAILAGMSRISLRFGLCFPDDWWCWAPFRVPPGVDGLLLLSVLLSKDVSNFLLSFHLPSQFSFLQVCFKKPINRIGARLPYWRLSSALLVAYLLTLKGWLRGSVCVVDTAALAFALMIWLGHRITGAWGVPAVIVWGPFLLGRSASSESMVFSSSWWGNWVGGRWEDVQIEKILLNIGAWLIDSDSFRGTAEWLSYICVCPLFFRFFPRIGYYRILSRVPCAVR